jgi:hypothetical protein
MKLLEILEPTKEELIADGSLPKNATDEDMFDKYELTGKIHIGKDINWNEYDKYNGKCFYCGPEIDVHGLSDSIYISHFMEVMKLSLGIELYIDASENSHELKTQSVEEADVIYERIKTYISERYEIYEEHEC